MLLPGRPATAAPVVSSNAERWQLLLQAGFLPSARSSPTPGQLQHTRSCAAAPVFPTGRGQREATQCTLSQGMRVLHPALGENR